MGRRRELTQYGSVRGQGSLSNRGIFRAPRNPDQRLPLKTLSTGAKGTKFGQTGKTGLSTRRPITAITNPVRVVSRETYYRGSRKHPANCGCPFCRGAYRSVKNPRGGPKSPRAKGGLNLSSGYDFKKKILS